MKWNVSVCRRFFKNLVHVVPSSVNRVIRGSLWEFQFHIFKIFLETTFLLSNLVPSTCSVSWGWIHKREIKHFWLKSSFYSKFDQFIILKMFLKAKVFFLILSLLLFGLDFFSEIQSQWWMFRLLGPNKYNRIYYISLYNIWCFFWMVFFVWFSALYW